MESTTTSPENLLQLGDAVRFVPSIHQRMVFADEVRRAAREFRPDALAVELPPGLAPWIERGATRLPALSAVCHPSARAGEMFHLPIDPADATIEAVRIGLEHDIPLVFLDGGFDPLHPTPADLHQYDLPDDWMIGRTGLEAYARAIFEAKPFRARAPEEDAREAWMAGALARAIRDGRRVLCVLGFAHWPGVRGRLAEALAEPDGPAREAALSALAHVPPAPRVEGAFLARLHRKSIPRALREIPRLVWLREEDRDELDFLEGGRFDKLERLVGLLKDAQLAYTERYKTDVSTMRFRALLQFLRNLPLVEGRLEPSLHDVILAAKGVVDGDFGWEVLELLRSYGEPRPRVPGVEPGEGEDDEDDDGLPVLHVRDGRGTLSDRTERYRMTSRFAEPDMRTVRLGFRRRPPAEQLERWKREWSRMQFGGICSWPPEDELLEKFIAFLRDRAARVLAESGRRSEEFSTSLLDGLDVRETTRNWHTGKLFVQRVPEPHGRVGAVVIVFDDERRDAFYPWRSTLYAENENESDLSFYATSIGEDVVGPGISRTHFGGILSVYPARRIPDLWNIVELRALKSCAESLLAGGLLFSEERIVAWVARRPPSSSLRDLAATCGKLIVHLPIQGLSEKRLSKIRRFHILNGHPVRKWAGDYIFD